jgi:hypothetical protein
VLIGRATVARKTPAPQSRIDFGHD